MIHPSQCPSAHTQFGHVVSMPSVRRHSNHNGHKAPSSFYQNTAPKQKRQLSKLPFGQSMRHYATLTTSFFKNLYHSAKVNAPKPSRGEGKFLQSVKIWIEDFMSILAEDVKRLWNYLTGGTNTHSHSHDHSHHHDHHH